MRIGHVTDWFHPRVGGIENHVRQTTRRLRERGLDAVAVTPWLGPDEVDGTPVFRVPLSPAPGLGVALPPGVVPAVERTLVAAKIDLVHAHVSIGSSAALGGLWAGARLGLPVLVTFHSVFGAWGLPYVAARALVGWHRWPFRATAVSPAVARDLRWMIPEHSVSLLPCAIEASEWEGLAPESVPGRLRLVTTSRLHHRKRVSALVRITDQVRRRVGASMDVTLTVVGEGAERRPLEGLIRRRSLGDAVTLLGGGDPTAVRALLARGDVFVNACPRESFGIAALEALAAGVPLVGRAGSGLSSFVHHGHNGLLLSSDAEMVDALVELALERGRVDRLKGGAGEGIPDAFTWDGILDRHVELYHDLLAGGTSERRGAVPWA